MNRKIRRKTVAALAASLAMVGALHAPLSAEETTPARDEINAEVIKTDALVDQRDLLAAAAAEALADAKASLTEDIRIELDVRLGPPAKLAVASND